MVKIAIKWQQFIVNPGLESMSAIIDITENAANYLGELLGKQDVEGIGVRVFVTQPGTPYAETCLAYCRPGEEEAEEGTLLSPFVTAVPVVFK